MEQDSPTLLPLPPLSCFILNVFEHFFVVIFFKLYRIDEKHFQWFLNSLKVTLQKSVHPMYTVFSNEDVHVYRTWLVWFLPTTTPLIIIIFFYGEMLQCLI